MTLKEQIRDRIFDVTGRATGIWPFSSLATRFFKNRHTIVFYHAVWKKGDGRLRLFGGVDVETFTHDLRRLADMFRFVSLSDSLADSERNDDRPAITITFDDGFDLIDGGAAEAMEALGIPATAFINSDSYRYERLLWQHAFGAIEALRGDRAFLQAFNEVQRAYALGPSITTLGSFIDAAQRWPQSRINALADEVWRIAGMPDMETFLAEHRPYLDHASLKEWADRGHEIGFHGKSHSWSSLLEPRGIDEQIVAPARKLKTELGLASLPFAYPFGDRLPAEREQAVAEAEVFYCMLGTDRLSRVGESPFEVDRIEADFGVERHLFGRPLIRALRRQDLRPLESG